MKKTDKGKDGRTKKANGMTPKVSPVLRPSDMDVNQWQSALRRQAADSTYFVITELTGEPGSYSVTNSRKRTCNTVRYYGPESPFNSCTCMDFRTNRLGTCKHLESVALSNAERQAIDPLKFSHGLLYVDYRNGRDVKLRIPYSLKKSFAAVTDRWTDDGETIDKNNFTKFEEIVKDVREFDQDFSIDGDVLEVVAEVNDARRRAAIERRLSDEQITNVLANGVKLYPYQLEGVRKAFKAGRCIIADDMGLGKTLQSIATARLLHSLGMIENVLIVCPTSLKYQWLKEIGRFTTASAEVIEGIHPVRKRKYEARQAFFSITSFHSLANDLKAIGRMHFDMVIIDEVQRLKNWETKLSINLKKLDSDYTVVLSGTPLENKIEELYSVMEFVDPYCLGPYHEFMSETVRRDEVGKVVGYRNLNRVGRRIADRMIRRKKADVAIQMPERIDSIRYVSMTDEQMAIHNESQSIVAQLVFKWRRMRFLSEKDRRRLLMELSKMRMVCDSTFILDQQSRYDTKVEECIDLITSAIDGLDTKIVVFSQWERMTRLIAKELDNKDITFAYLHGGVPSEKRGALISDFNSNPECRVFLSTDAGSTGLNLQSASIIINLDLPWNPAVLEQRIARIYRIGQKRNVQVINFVAAGTIEERMLSTLDFKTALFEGILDNGDDSITLSDNKLTKIADTYEALYKENDNKLDKDAAEIKTPKDNKGEHEPNEESNSKVESAVTKESKEADRDNTSPSLANGVRSTPDADTSHADNPEQLIAGGMQFLSGLAKTLKSPEATKKLVDTLVKIDKKTGQSTLSIPVPDKETVSNVLTMFANLLSATNR